MAPRHAGTDPPNAYTPTSDQRRKRRAEDADAAELRRWWRRVVKPTEILAGAALLLGALAFFDYRRESPRDAIAAEAIVRAHSDTTLHDEFVLNATRIEKLNQRLDSVSDRVLFMAYLSCQQSKASGPVIPAWASARCDSIIQKRLAP